MTTSPTSYLQTLAQDEAIAFVASLQKVKIHLSHDLTWMGQQIQQKTVQLQGLETLLAEAVALGLVNASETTVATIAGSSAANGSGLVTLPMAVPVTSKPASNGNAAPTEPLPLTADLTPPPAKSARGKRVQSTVTPKNGASPKVKRTPSNTSQPARESTQMFVQSQFQDQSITDAIGEILKRSRSPLSADDIMATLYDGLSDEAYKRAKNSVTNILSVGRGKGKWKSAGRGLYANNAVATA